MQNVKRNAANLEAQTFEGRFLPSIWPGMYPAAYVTAQNEVLCHQCATEAMHDDVDPVVDVFAHFEGPSLHCGDCSAEIESAYGDPEEEEEEEEAL